MLNVPMGTPDAVAQDIRKMPYSPFAVVIFHNFIPLT